jgi:outer membrane protein OmpA-like peptidoglycan-associated protein
MSYSKGERTMSEAPISTQRSPMSALPRVFIRRGLPAVLLAFASSVCGAATLASADAAGSRDHEQLRRYEGSVILSYAQSAFDEFALPLSALVEVPGESDAKNNVVFRPPSSKPLEGRHTLLVYLLPEGRSTLEVVRNYRDEIERSGGTALFECADAACGGEATYGMFGGGSRTSLAMFLQAPEKVTDAYRSIGWCARDSTHADQRYLAAEVPPQNMHVSVHAYRIVAPDAGPPCALLNGRTIAVVDVIDGKPRENRMVTVSAAEMAGAIASSGSIALYGILFDFNQAVVKPESEPALTEIAKYLSDPPGTKVLIVGHTDNVGSYAFNLDLSQRRAAAVVDALVSRYRVARERMTPIGVSFASPVASNRDENGRAKNRRVALVAVN